MRSFFENNQVIIYFSTIVVAGFIGWAIPSAASMEVAINPALAFMLFVTFLQVPLRELGAALRSGRFLAALLVANFVVMPIVTAALIQLLPDDPLLRLAVLFVLLTPCIDYVVTFTHLGRGDARLLLAATPVLLILQMILLPIYLGLLVGESAAGLVQPEPFVHAFVILIAIPLALAAVVQICGTKSTIGERVVDALGYLPVPATAVVLFIVVASVMTRIGEASSAAKTAAPIYVLYAIIAPVCGILIARAVGLNAEAGRAVAFSAATRNSLVILPLALVVPGAIPIIPAVIVTQTMIELLSELVYVRLIPRLLPIRDLAAS